MDNVNIKHDNKIIFNNMIDIVFGNFKEYYKHNECLNFPEMNYDPINCECFSC